MGRVVTPRPPLVNKSGLFCLPSYPQTTDLPGLRAPMWIVPHLKQPTIHARGRFPGRSPFKTGDRPHWDLFSRTVAFQNWGPSTPEAVFPDGQRLERGGTVQGDMPPPARGCLRRGGHVPEGQAGVAGAARPRRKESRLCDANKAAPGRKESRLCDANKATRDAGKTGTSADQRQERGEIVAGVVTRNRYVSGGGGCCRRRRRS